MENINKNSATSHSTTQLDRLKYLIERSHRSQAAFSKHIGLDPSTLSRIVTGRQPMSDAFVFRLVATLGISRQWFVSGEGVPFPRAAECLPVENVDTATLDESARPKGAPVYDIEAKAGSTPISRIFAEDRIIGYLDIPQIDPANPVIRVSGDSMSSKIPDGAYISIRRVRDTGIILWGAIYFVQLEDYMVVKYVRRHPSDDSMVVLHSENPEYQDMEVPRKAIIGLFIVENILNLRTIA